MSMIDDLFDSLNPGDAIRITFGRDASQVAVVHDRTRAGNLRGYKFSAKRKVWKGPIRIYRRELISRVPQSVLTTMPPLPSRSGGRS